MGNITRLQISPDTQSHSVAVSHLKRDDFWFQDFFFLPFLLFPLPFFCPRNAKYNYADLFFSMSTTQNNGFNICPYLQQVFCMQIRWDFRDGEAECLSHPSFVARRIKGDLLWFVNMRAFDSDWNETMCRIRLKTMCGEWRLRHVLDFTHPYTDVHHCGPIVWPGFCCEVGFCPVSVL